MQWCVHACKCILTNLIGVERGEKGTAKKIVVFVLLFGFSSLLFLFSFPFSPWPLKASSRSGAFRGGRYGSKTYVTRKS